jgi:hypothetical protein
MVISVLRKYLLWLLIPVSMLGILSCEKILLGKDPANDPVENFELLWHNLDQKYSFFTYKNVNWQAVYDEYRPQVYSGMSDAALFDVMRNMIYELRDGHTSLSSPFDLARNWDWYLNSPPNYNFDIIEREYLGNDYLITGPFLNQFLDSVGYIHYRSFGSGFTAEQLNFVLQRFENTKGLIIDVRNNGGGNSDFAQFLAARFTNEEVLTQYWLYKTGPGHDDFSSPEPKYLTPSQGTRYTKPVVVLTNRSSYSATNDFVLSMSALPNVTLLGDTTGGGGGIPISSELPNGWLYRFSSTMTLAPNGFNVEHGIPPNIAINQDPVDEQNDIDTLIEKALEVLGE